MRKKQIIERLDAIRTEAAALLEAESFDSARSEALTQEQETLGAELEKIEALEAKIKAGGARRVEVTDNGTRKPWTNFGEFLSAVARADTGQTRDPRLQTFASGANEAIGSEGGFLVGQDTAAAFLDRAYAQAPVASRCFQLPISAGSNGVKINGFDETSRANGSRWGGVQAYWASEAATVTASQPKLRKVELELKKVFALVYATEELLQDSAAFSAVVNNALPQEIAFKLDDAIINGTGAGQPLGILNSDALVSQAAEGSQTATTFNFANLAKMYARLWSRSRGNAVWFINQDVEPQLITMASAASSANQLVYMPPGGVSNQPYGTLFGRPVIPIEQCATMGTVGDVIFADMSQYALATKGGVQGAVSMHVRFIYDESVFKFTLRVDGRPLWHNKLTPFKGSNTQSPFIAVATR